MSDLSEPIACEVSPIKKGWKILSGGVRIGLASSRERALDKIMRLSASSGVLYHVRIYKENGRLETETSCFPPREPSREMDTCLPAISEAVAEESTQIPDAANHRFHTEQADAGTSVRERIALLAYSYWEKRGRQGGSPEEDWFWAEREILGQESFSLVAPAGPSQNLTSDAKL